MRREHALWLTAAMRGTMPTPRIPVRRVDDGGFGPMLRRSTGRRRADAWWDAAFERVEDRQFSDGLDGPVESGGDPADSG